jgi:uncharacterized protein with HEPN domain
MQKHDKDKIRLKHISDEAKEALKYTKNITFQEFVKDGKTVRAVVRSLEIIGEAASKISVEFRQEHSEVPWQEIIAMRNRLIHVYFDVDYNIIWKTIKENLPALIEQLSRILKNEK